MASDQDQSQKTEEPTQKKLQDAHKKGDVAKSQEVTTFFSLCMVTLLIGFFATSIVGKTGDALRVFLEMPHQRGFTLGDMKTLFREVGWILFGAISIPLAFSIFGGVAGNLVQHKPVFTTERMKPKLEKISPAKGLKRMFGATGLVNFAKGLAKILLVSAVVFALFWPERKFLPTLISTDPALVLPIIKGLAMKMMWAVLAIVAVLAILDFTYQKFDFNKRQRMSRQEIKDEHKQSDGDPKVKARLRQIRMERAQRRMMAEVPNATVVIANPTHFAVALKYESGVTGAPICVAKGVDAIALKIREIAEESRVPVVENPPLARSLYASVEIDDEIPPEHYKAVAEVVGYVMRLDKRQRA